MDLNIFWFLLIGVLFTGYAMLDGFDFGVGMLHLFTKKDEHRRLMLNSIGPVWDGNEVWLVTGGGALFAAFPEAYATVFSAFYIPFMLLLASLIFRAVAIEFRSKTVSPIWRSCWDVAFFGGSLLSSFLIGMTIGNIVCGIPLDEHFNYTGEFGELMNPYAIFTGLTVIVLFMMHGSMYVVLKTEGELQQMAKKWVAQTVVVFLCFYVVFNILTLLFVPEIKHILLRRPHIGVVFLLNILAVANVVRELQKGRTLRAFICSCLSMLFLMVLFGLTMFPNLVFAYPHSGNSINIYNGASTQDTLQIMMWVALIGSPMVIAYTVSVYWIFRGKVSLTSESY
jgi:cytochrome bd ubiquinol oxidase subunit II